MNQAETKVIAEGHKSQTCNAVLRKFGVSRDWQVATDVEPAYKWVKRSERGVYKEVQKLDPKRVLILKYQGSEVCRCDKDGDMVWLCRLVGLQHGKSCLTDD